MNSISSNTDEKIANFISKTIICLFLIFIIWPNPLYRVAHYNLKMGYMVLICISAILPWIVLFDKGYLGHKITKMIWFLRVLALIIFVGVGVEYGVSRVDLISFGGTIIITFFYEVGFIIVRTRQLEFFLKSVVWCVFSLCLYLQLFLIPLVYRYRLPAAFMPIMRDNYHHEWPNAFSMVLILAILINFYLIKRGKEYFVTLFVIFVTLVLTFCRTSFAILGIVVIYLCYAQKGAFFRRFIRTAVIGCLMVLLFFWVNTVKEESYRNISGTKLIHSQKMRISRWVSILKGIENRPVFGVGFRSAVINIPVIRTYSGEITGMHSAHNDYIDLLLRAGALYSFIFWSFVLMMVFRGFKRVDNESKVFRYLSLSMVALLMGCLTQNLLKDPFTASFFWIYIAAIGDFTSKRIVVVSKGRLGKLAERDLARTDY